MKATMPAMIMPEPSKERLSPQQELKRAATPESRNRLPMIFHFVMCMFAVYGDAG